MEMFYDARLEQLTNTSKQSGNKTLKITAVYVKDLFSDLKNSGTINNVCI